MFRVTKEYHLVSLVTAILPSPDWFLGASHLELCVPDENKWAVSRKLNLYPMDAGTDKGTDFNVSNLRIKNKDRINKFSSVVHELGHVKLIFNMPIQVKFAIP